MNENTATSEPRRNAVESWPIFDTVQIGQGQADVSKAGWYNSFAELGNETQIPFFDQRTRSSVGPMYCNLDSAEQVPYPYTAYSIGVEVKTPSLADFHANFPQIESQSKSCNYETFVDMFKHAAFRLQVSQDEKILSNTMTLPGGVGGDGFYNGVSINPVNNYTSKFNMYNNGMAVIKNRLRLQNPVHIPRNRNISGSLIFSTYARDVLQGLEGPLVTPLSIPASPATGVALDYGVNAVCQIRVSLIGARQVQQRNDLHFAG